MFFRFGERVLICGALKEGARAIRYEKNIFFEVDIVLWGRKYTELKYGI